MKWFKKQVKNNSELTNVSDDELEEIFDFHKSEIDTRSPRGGLNSVQQSAAVSIAVHLITDILKTLKPVLKDKTNDELIRDHELLDFLEQPCPYFNFSQILEFLGIERLTTGNNFLLSVGETSLKQSSIFPISISEISANGHDKIDSLLLSSGLYAGSYEESINTVNNDLYYQRDPITIISIDKDYSSKSSSMLLGDSPLEALNEEIKQLFEGAAFTTNSIIKGNVLKMLFHFNAELDNDEFKTLKQRVRTEFSGSSGNSIGVTSGQDLDIKTLAATNKDMEFIEILERGFKLISQRLKIPLPLLIGSTATLDNYAQARLALYDDAVLPLADIIFNFLNKTLAERWGLDKTLKLTYDVDSIKALKLRSLNNLVLRKDLNIETINELRAEAGRERVENGDQIYQSSTLFPIGQNNNKDLENKNFKSNILKKKLKTKFDNRLNKRRFYTIEFKNLEKIEEKNARKISQKLKAQKNNIFRELRKNNGLLSESEILRILNNSGKDFLKVLNDNYLESMDFGFKNVIVNNKAIDNEFLLLFESILEEEQIILVEKSQIDESTTNLILDNIQKANAEGLNVNKLQDLIINSGIFSSVRALRIARTVSGTGQSLGQLEGALSANANEKEWIDSGFEVRLQHQERNGERIDINSTFSAKFGNSRPRYPLDQKIKVADRINCRCSMKFYE